MTQGGQSLSDIDFTTRTCTKCGRTLPATAEFFDRARNFKFGLNSRCKVCRYEYNRVHAKTYKRKYRVLTEAQKQAKAANNRANREIYNARRRAWRAEHPEEKLAYDRTYRATHREQVTAYDRNRVALERGAEGTHTAEDVKAQYERQKGRCFWCNKKISDYHVDHVVPLTKGGSNGPENLVIACPSCNHIKSAKHPMDFAGILF